MRQKRVFVGGLVAITVGLATVVAVNSFSASAISTDMEAVRQDLTAIANSAQSYFTEAASLCEGGGSFDKFTFRDIDFESDFINTNGKIARNSNGFYAIVSTRDGRLVVEGSPRVDVAVSQDLTNIPITEYTLRATITHNSIKLSRAEKD